MTKSNLRAALGLVLACLGSEAAAADYTIQIESGFNYIANHLHHPGGNDLNTILSLVPDGSELFKWDKATASYFDPDVYIAGIGWIDSATFNPSTTTLEPGEGAAFLNPIGPFSVTFTGSTMVPILPLSIPAGTFCFVSRQIPGVGTYENIVGCPPLIGSTLERYDTALGMTVTFTYGVAGWSPGVPLVNLGESVFINGPTCSNSLPSEVKWSQPPGYLVFEEDPDMHGGNRPSDFDWEQIMNPGNFSTNWVVADDFISDGRPIIGVRWWGSYFDGEVPGFEDGFALSFFRDIPAQPGDEAGFSRPGSLLGAYLAPLDAVHVEDTGFIGWDDHRIYQYEVLLKNTCLDHGVDGIAQPEAFLESSNSVYWLSIAAEVGHLVIPVTDTNGTIIDWVGEPTGKQVEPGTHFWGWHTSPIDALCRSVTGDLTMNSNDWIYGRWITNDLYHMEMDQAFYLLTGSTDMPCETNPPTVVAVSADCDLGEITVTYSEPMDPSTATDTARYLLSSGAILSATLNAAGDEVVLQSTPLACDTTNVLVIRGVTDLCTNIIIPNPYSFSFLCPPCPPDEKVAKWSQWPGFLIFTNAPDQHGETRLSDFDWTLLTSTTNIVEPNQVIADDFRSDGRPILCVRWWGAYLPGFEPDQDGQIYFEDAYVLSFFSDVRPTNDFSRPGNLLATYVAPREAVKIEITPYLSWDNHRIYQYEVQLSDTCLEHGNPEIARPEAFLEFSNVVYWVSIAAEVGHRVVAVTNQLGQIVDWEEESSGKQADQHFWGWLSHPNQVLDVSVNGHLLMRGMDWIYPRELWRPNEPIHDEFDQAFELLTGRDLPSRKVPKWYQPPGYLVFNSPKAGDQPDERGGNRPSSFNWTDLGEPTNGLGTNWVMADDFRSDGRPIKCVRWWGSYPAEYLPSQGSSGFFEDGYALSFFRDVRPTNAFSHPGALLGTYLAPIEAVKVTPTPYTGWDGHRIFEYIVELAATCLEHAETNIATPSAFLERSNVVYWLSISAEVGCRVIPFTNDTIVTWTTVPTGKVATNHFWGWHTTPADIECRSVMGFLTMNGTDWVYPEDLWRPNEPYHHEFDQAFSLLTDVPGPCVRPGYIWIARSGTGNIKLHWIGLGYDLESTGVLADPSAATIWINVPGSSPLVQPIGTLPRFFRLICP